MFICFPLGFLGVKMGPNSIISRYCSQGGNPGVAAIPVPGANSHRSKWLPAQAELPLCHCHGSESSMSYSHGSVHCYFSPSVLGLLLLLTCRYFNTGICFPEVYGTDCKCCIIFQNLSAMKTHQFFLSFQERCPFTAAQLHHLDNNDLLVQPSSLFRDALWSKVRNW